MCNRREAARQLVQSLEAARPHTSHVWRDTPAMNADATVNAYIEIPRGDLRKWEFDMKANARAIDRVMPPDVGGYPVNYGFVPQTVSYDGDPFDVLVLGPALPGGELVRGAIVGVMFMEDEKGLDSKVVVSPVDSAGRPRHVLSRADRETIGRYFARYKQHEPGKFSKVPGWGTPADGLAHVRTARAFFFECAKTAGRCTLPSDAPNPGHADDSSRHIFCISFPQQQRGLRSPPAPACGPFVTSISQPQSESGQRYFSPFCSAMMTSLSG